MPLQIRRGLSSDLAPTFIPSEGEPIYTLDTGKLYIGDGVSNGLTLQPLNQDVTLGSLQDVNVIGLSDGYILQYNLLAQAWNAVSLQLNTFPELSLSSFAADGQVLRFDGDPISATSNTYTTAYLRTGDLEDIDGTVTPVNGDVLVYDAGVSAYVPQAYNPSISNASDVVLTSLSNGQVLAWDAVTSKWVNQAVSGGSSNLDGLTDVTISTALDGQVLTYNASTSQWINQSPTSGGSSTIGGLTDVNISSIVDGQALIYDSASGTWQNQTLSSGGALSLDNLTDVSASAPNDGDVIAYNASTSTWVTTAPAGGGGGGLSSRTTASASTASIADGTSDNIVITAAKTYALLSIQTSAAAWVTLYTDSTSRTNDASRNETTDPLPGSGVIAEVITSGAVTQLITPGTLGFNFDTPAGSSVYAKVVNKSGSTQSVTVTLNYVALEA